jgi:RNA polymerase sigma factor for flagellar operon FliA
MKAIVEKYRFTEQNTNDYMGVDDREALIREHAPHVKYIAERFAVRLPSHITVEELESAGTVGLLDALNNFDPGKGVKFKTYATYRIKGAMLDELRRMDWAPRSVRRDVQKIETAVNDARFRYGREPSNTEIARELGVDMNGYFKMLQGTQGVKVLSLDDKGPDGAQSNFDKLASNERSPLEEVQKKELKHILAAALKTLTKREQMVMSLYYYDELTLKEIAEILGVTESRVSQIHSKVILSLRTKLKNTDLN